MSRVTALGIPSPWSGDENDPRPRSYAAWAWLYRHSRRWRHRIGLHDWAIYGVWPPLAVCTWCGANR